MNWVLYNLLSDHLFIWVITSALSHRWQFITKLSMFLTYLLLASLKSCWMMALICVGDSSFWFLLPPVLGHPHVLGQLSVHSITLFCVSSQLSQCWLSLQSNRNTLTLIQEIQLIKGTKNLCCQKFTALQPDYGSVKYRYSSVTGRSYFVHNDMMILTCLYLQSHCSLRLYEHK